MDVIIVVLCINLLFKSSCCEFMYGCRMRQNAKYWFCCVPVMIIVLGSILQCLNQQNSFYWCGAWQRICFRQVISHKYRGHQRVAFGGLGLLSGVWSTISLRQRQAIVLGHGSIADGYAWMCLMAWSGICWISYERGGS